MGHACAHTWAIYGSSNGAYMRAYMAIYARIHGPHGSSNGAYMRAYMGHMGVAMGHTWAYIWAIWEQQWGMHARIHGPHGSSNGACMRAYMAIYGSSLIGRAGRKGIAGNPFPSLDQGRELPRAYPFPSLPCSAAYI